MSNNNSINWNEMISPSSIRNYMLNDTLTDWLKHNHTIDINYNNNKNVLTKTVKKIKNSNNLFLNFIMDQGCKFEDVVFKELSKNYNCIKVGESYEARSVEKFKKTVSLIKSGCDIIYQGVLHDYELKLYGCPDLIVRSDKLNSIFNCDIIDDNNKDYHYVIIDIKHSTLNLSTNKINILNSNSMPAYKGQILIYNKILGNIQNYQPRYGYILGKKYIHRNNINYNYLGQLGVVDFNDYDKKYINIVDKAIKWVHNLRNNGNKWKIFPTPSIPELYPNMKINNSVTKEKISKELGEITSVWYCSLKHRENCHKRKIYSWHNEECNTENMGMKNSKRSRTIDKMLEINRNKNDLIDLNELFSYDWDFFGRGKKEFYLDFETIDSNMGNLTGPSNQSIFMIGVGWDEDGEWKFKCFYLEDLNNNNEKNMIIDFYNFIKEKERYFGKKSVFLHWTHAEPQFIGKSCAKYNLDYSFNFFDLYELFIENNIVVKNALNFSLKTISRALYDNNLIKTCWDKDNICSNGLNAMYLAYDFYKNTKDKNIMDSIIKYNEIDCKVMYEILKYIRTEYLNKN